VEFNLLQLGWTHESQKLQKIDLELFLTNLSQIEQKNFGIKGKISREKKKTKKKQKQKKTTNKKSKSEFKQRKKPNY